jgi:hypothetical protein
MRERTTRFESDCAVTQSSRFALHPKESTLAIQGQVVPFVVAKREKDPFAARRKRCCDLQNSDIPDLH